MQKKRISFLKFLLPLVVLALVVGTILTVKPAKAAGPYYWVGGTGNWTDATAHWSTSSGGAPGAGNTPTTTDNVIFDAASDTAGAFTVTVNGAANCADITFSAVDQTVTFAGNQALNVYGSLAKKTGMIWTYSGLLTFKSTATGKTITNNSVAYAGAITFNGVGGGWQFQDASTGITTLTLTNGTLDTNGQTVGTTSFTTAAGTNTLTLGATTWNNAGDWYQVSH